MYTILVYYPIIKKESIYNRYDVMKGSKVVK